MAKVLIVEDDSTIRTSVVRALSERGHVGVVVNETSVEVCRGVWLKFSPQFRSAGGAQGSTNLRRLEFAADLLPRTHWHVNVSYYHDHAFAASTSALLVQMHLFM